MEAVSIEPGDYQYHAISALFVLALLICFMSGVWLRSHVLAPPTKMGRKEYFIISIPTGLILSGFYAKSAVAGFSANPDGIVFDAVMSFGYLAFVGTMSRDAMETLVSRIHKS